MNSEKPRFQYHKVYQDIRDKIEQGIVKQGQRLPTEKEMQEEHGVSRDTVRRALAKLEQEGFINRKSALGTFVRQTKSDYQLSSMKGFSEQMRSRGIKPSSDLDRIELSTSVKPHIREHLRLPEGEKCYIISRTRKGDGAPMAYETVYIPYALCPDIQKYIDDETSLYDVYENVYHHQLGVGTIRLEADIPNQKLQEKLGITRESPILLMNCVVCLMNGTPLYYVDCFYVSEKYFFSTQIYR